MEDRIVQEILRSRHQGGLHHDRCENVRRSADFHSKEFRGRYADYGELAPGKRDVAAYDPGVRCETAFPISVTDHRDGMAIGDKVVFWIDRAAGRGFDAENWEVIPGDELALRGGLEAALNAHLDANARVSSQTGEIF